MLTYAHQTDYSGLILIGLVANAVISAGFSCVVADDKGHSGGLWGFLGLLFGPFALFAIGVMGRARPDAAAVYIANTVIGNIRTLKPAEPEAPQAPRSSRSIVGMLAEDRIFS